MHICMHFNTLKIFDKEIRCKLTSEVSTKVEYVNIFFDISNVNYFSL